ncbi:MAG: peptide deformylase [Clostridiales bacterium]|nr:MAG: peptide deformylase [Clostridiales bacterium]
MALRDIVKEPDERLKKVCRPVKEITPHILTLLDDMAETMNFAEGVGLAAPQVGVLRRIVVIDVGEGLIELINPEIIAFSGEQTGPEACLSCGERRGIVTRPSKVTVRALDRYGKMQEYTGEGLLARAFCHELDHLDGVLFLDRMSREMAEDEEYPEEG